MTDLLTVKDLRVKFRVHGGTVDAVKGVNFTIRQGSTVALVGESGSGKSVISQCIMGILPSTGEITGGHLLFADPKKSGEIIDIAKIPHNSAEMRAIRGGRISIIFQEPMTSLLRQPCSPECISRYPGRLLQGPQALCNQVRLRRV